jgi:hypothetical protein
MWCELLYNMWWWPLNLLWSWLVCELVWNPSWFHGLPGYTGLSLLNRLLWRVIFLLNFVWLVGSVTTSAHVLRAPRLVLLRSPRVLLLRLHRRACVWGPPSYMRERGWEHSTRTRVDLGACSTVEDQAWWRRGAWFYGRWVLARSSALHELMHFD